MSDERKYCLKCKTFHAMHQDCSQQTAASSFAGPSGSARTCVREAYGQWFVYDHVLARVLCMSTHETDAHVISESVNKWCEKFRKEKAPNDAAQRP